jgi:hypothetical protein
MTFAMILMREGGAYMRRSEERTGRTTSRSDHIISARFSVARIGGFR